MTFPKLLLNLKSVHPKRRYRHFLGQGTWRYRFFNNRGFQSKNLFNVWTVFWKACIVTFQKSNTNFWTRIWGLATKYSSKKALKLTDAEKTQTFENLCGVGADRIWLKLVWDTWDHCWTIIDLSFLWQFCST
jgi:hypothetical protein